jgi:RNA polymerase sigma-70 factor (ECF subfamily)
MANDDTRLTVIAGVRSQDPERWREFDSIYRPMLFSYLRKQGLKDFEANDVVQDVFVKLLAKIQTYDPAKCKFRGWLFSLAHNAMIDRARQRASYQKALDGWAAHVLEATPSDSLRMEQEWVKLHRKRILEHALKTVRGRTSAKAWSCFDQRVLRNRPAALVATEVKLNPKAVYVYACRVLKQVRTLCQQFDEDISESVEPPA